MKILSKKAVLTSSIITLALSSSVLLSGCGASSHEQTSTIAGSVLGGVVGHQFGKGNGKKAATVAGAIAGGVIGGNMSRNNRRHSYR
ncbi:MAG: glycine zipper 2TM domain-containing protein [Gammaproteobacteria bacterium]|nr:glycine zipper 2TM domain-containing protein [Gammaproteobacteria bacterium]